MKKIFIFTMICLALCANAESADATKKLTISRLDKIEIKRIGAKYLALLINNAGKEILKKYYSQKVLLPGSGEPEVYITDSHVFNKIEFEKDENYGVIVKLYVSLHLVAKIDKNGYKSIDKRHSSILGFVREDYKWKIANPIIGSLYLTRDSAIKWAKDIQNEKVQGNRTVSKLILDNLE